MSTGKLLRVEDESLDQYKEALEKNELALDTFHFNKKMKTELLIQEKAKNEGLDSPINCVFDRSDKFVVFGSFVGIKIVEVGATAKAEEQVATGKAEVVMGEVENTERFMNVSLFQGIARVSSQVAAAKSD